MPRITLENRTRAGTQIGQRLGLPAGHLSSLRRERGWSFTIKMHALLEATLSAAILDTLQRPKLETWLSKAPMWSKRRIAEAVDLMDTRSVSFLDQLSTLRNKFTHDPRYVSHGVVALLQAHLKPGEFTKAVADLAFAMAEASRRSFFMQKPEE